MTITKTAAPLPSASLSSLIDAMREWLDSFLNLVVLEGKEAGFGLALMLGLGLGAAVLLFTGWLAMVACAVAALVENDVLGWIGSLLLIALVNFAAAGGLAFTAIRRSKHLMFAATRRQLGLKPVSAPNHE